MRIFADSVRSKPSFAGDPESLLTLRRAPQSTLQRGETLQSVLCQKLTYHLATRVRSQRMVIDLINFFHVHRLIAFPQFMLDRQKLSDQMEKFQVVGPGSLITSSGALIAR